MNNLKGRVAATRGGKRSFPGGVVHSRSAILALRTEDIANALIKICLFQTNKLQIDGYNMKNQRFREIDALRGTAIVMMVVFHFFFDLNYFGILKNGMYEGSWLAWQRITISLFLILVGVSITLSYGKEGREKKEFLLKNFKRGLFVFAAGMLVTAGTYVYPKEGFIIFGILQFIGIAIIIAPLFLGFRYLNIIFAAAAIAAGSLVRSVHSGSLLLLPLGITPAHFYTLDYVPLFPYFGLVLIGLFLGKTLYPDGKRGFEMPKNFNFGNGLEFLGRNSLLIYLMHQPILIGLINAYLMLV